MNRRSPTFLRALLLLLLAIGPMQAQSVFACAMMDTVVHDCCCEGHTAEDRCMNSDCDQAFGAGDTPCCEPAIEVGIDQEAGKNTPPVKSTEVRSGLDPPQALVSSFDGLSPSPPCLVDGVVHSLPAAGQSGSETYLVTQRLRI
jgi:hypothetical protein